MKFTNPFTSLMRGRNILRLYYMKMFLDISVCGCASGAFPFKTSRLSRGDGNALKFRINFNLNFQDKPGSALRACEILCFFFVVVFFFFGFVLFCVFLFFHVRASRAERTRWISILKDLFRIMVSIFQTLRSFQYSYIETDVYLNDLAISRSIHVKVKYEANSIL